MEALVWLGTSVRVLTVILGTVAFLYLLRVRTLKSSNWHRKMKDIWWGHLIGVYAVTQANVEYLFREELPTLSSIFFIFILWWTIHGIRSGDMYTNETPYCVHPELHPEVFETKEEPIRLFKRYL